jgi:hypothetical protein
VISAPAASGAVATGGTMLSPLDEEVESAGEEDADGDHEDADAEDARPEDAVGVQQADESGDHHEPGHHRDGTDVSVDCVPVDAHGVAFR